MRGFSATQPCGGDAMQTSVPPPTFTCLPVDGRKAAPTDSRESPDPNRRTNAPQKNRRHDPTIIGGGSVLSTTCKSLFAAIFAFLPLVLATGVALLGVLVTLATLDACGVLRVIGHDFADGHHQQSGHTTQ
jgi:hypothetical protein